MQLEAGQTGVLLGATGAGKTSLLRALAGLQQLQAKHLSIGDITVLSDGCPPVPTHKRGLSLAPQGLALLSDRTVRSNIALGLDRHHEQRINECMQTLGICHLATYLPRQLSGGQARLVALARALAPAPALVLLDEPSTGLDLSIRQRLPLLTRALLPASSALLMTTQDCDEAFLWADYLGVLDNGRLLTWEDAQQLWQQPASATIAKHAGLGDLLPATLQRQQDDSYQAGTAFGKIHLKRAPTATELKNGCFLLVRPGELELADAGVQARVQGFAVRGGCAGLRLVAPVTEESCWLPWRENAPVPAVNTLLRVRLNCKKVVLLPR